MARTRPKLRKVPRSGAQIARYGFVRTMFGKAALFETMVSNETG